MENTGSVTLGTIEGQSGAYFDEDDVVRFKGVYGLEKSVQMGSNGSYHWNIFRLKIKKLSIFTTRGNICKQFIVIFLNQFG